MSRRSGSHPPSRDSRPEPLNAGPFAVSCNVRIPKGFPGRSFVLSLSLSLSGARKRDFLGREEGGFGLRERDTRTGIMWAERNEYLLPESSL